MHTRIYTYICTYTYTYIFIHIYIYTHIYVYVYIYIYIYIHIYIHIYVNRYASKYIYVYVYIHIHMYVYMYLSYIRDMLSCAFAMNLADGITEVVLEACGNRFACAPTAHGKRRRLVYTTVHTVLQLKLGATRAGHVCS